MQLSLVLGLVLLAAVVSAYPEHWIDKSGKVAQALRGTSAQDACALLPEKAYGGHSGTAIDRDSSISLNDAISQEVSKGTLCSGHGYNGQIAFPSGSERKAILVASAGEVVYSNEASTLTHAASDSACMGKRLWWCDGEFNTIPFHLHIPATTAPGQHVVLKVVSASNSHDSFHIVTATFIVEDCSSKPADSDSNDDASRAQRRQLQQTKVGGYSGACAKGQYDGVSCSKSDKGYKCQVVSDNGGHFVAHYSVGGCPPSNPCTDIADWYIQSSDIASEPVLHMYATGESRGYVSLAFATDHTKMEGGDAVFAFKDGEEVKAYVFPLKNEVANKADESFPVKDYLAYFGFLQDGDNTSICFGRVADLTSKNIAKINVPKIDYTKLQLTWAKDDAARIATHFSDEYGRGNWLLNLDTGASATASLKSDLDDFRVAHGALLATAWAFLVPVAILHARHKWYFSKTWFNVHRGFNALAFTLTLIGCIIAFVKLDIVHEVEGSTDIGNAHKILGIIMFSFAGLQFLLAWQPIRPGKDHKYRALWNNVHWWLGRITLLGTLSSIFLGIYLIHHVVSEKSRGDYAAWLVPVCLVLGAVIGFDVFLSLKKVKKDKEAQRREVEVPVAKTVEGEIGGGDDINLSVK